MLGMMIDKLPDGRKAHQKDAQSYGESRIRGITDAKARANLSFYQSIYQIRISLFGQNPEEEDRIHISQVEFSKLARCLFQNSFLMTRSAGGIGFVLQQCS